MKKCSTKLWKVMKICAAQTMIAMIVCGVSAAHENYAQLLDRKVTLSLKEVTLETALYQLEDVSSVKIFFSIEQIERSESESITMEAKEETLRNVLNQLLSPYNIKYKVDEKNGTIIILKKNLDQSMYDEPEIVTERSDARSMQVHKLATITGKVMDATTQQSMAGVNIVVKGTTNGTTSDSNGNYSIGVNDKDILIFSFIGYTSFETQVDGRSVVDITLQEDIKSLTEVVVNAGYYETTKEFQTGSIVKIDSKDIEKQPVSNPIAALQGRVAGLEVTQQNGVPGGNFKVRIRGTNSIANGNDPLYIIDGVPYLSSVMSFSETSGNILGSSAPNASQGSSPLNSINPSDIESIEVLKDADATAIYGSRGANGVILITTKKGQEGRTKVDLNFYTGVAKVGNRMSLLNTQQYVQMRKEAFGNDGMTPTAADAPDLVAWDTTRYTDWQKELIGGSAHITDAQFSISGGEKNTQFLIGSGFHRETTVFPGENSDQRISVHANITNRSVNEKLKTSLSVNYSVNSTDLLSEDLTSRALTLSPNAPALYDENGKLSWTDWNTIENPLAFLKRKYEATTNNLIGNAVVSYSIIPFLEAKVNLGYTNITNKAVTAIPISSLNPAATQINRSIFSNSSFQNWIAEPQLIWKPTVGFGAIDVLIGTTFMEQKNDGLAQYANGFSSEALMKNIGSAPSIIAATNYYSQYRYHAVFGRLNYVLKEKYIVNITGRRDGSSRFGPGKQFAVFGAIGTAWLFTKEDFIKNVMPFFSSGKLRASYGTTGNDQIGDYQYLDTYTSSGTYQGKVGLTPLRLYNPDFAWETNRKLEGGIEMGFLNDRILLGINYYRNRSSNQLVALPLAPTTGFPSIQGNLPAIVQNTGVEIELNTRNIEISDFTWSTSFNMTIPRNKLVEFPNLSSSPAYDEIYVVGRPLDIKKLYNYEGINPATGVYQFTDINEDGVYDVADRQTVKFVGREYFGGILNSFQYKGFRLEVLFQYVKQQGYNYTHLFYSTPGTLSNQPELVMNRWRSEGNAEVQKFSTGGDASNAYSSLLYTSNKAISDASFIRLKNVSLSYTFPGEWIRTVKASKASVFLQAQNLLTITNYGGLDPETPGAGILPPLRTITAGIHFTF